MPFGASHSVLVILAKSAITTFFRRIEVNGTENVPDEGPIIFNMAVDPAVLSNAIPSKYYLHYWVKDSLFKNPAMGALLRNAGNIAVDRKNKNNQLLFKGSFEALQVGECIGVFPEGTSHTEPHMIPPKDGTSWAALEYLRYLEGTPENGGKKNGRKAVVVPVALCYTEKSKFRSRVVVQLCEPIAMDSFEEQFLSDKEGESRLAVKRLTRTIEMALWRHTVNAPDWDTAYAAQMARELLWEKDDDLKLVDFVDVSQTLVDLFNTPHPRITALKSLLVTYHRLLASSRLSNASLVDLPLPRTLNPSEAISLPSRFTALWLFIRDTILSLLLLPFFAVPLIINIPMYCVAVLGGRIVEEELETVAQMKIAFGLLLSLLVYPVLFFAFWALVKGAAKGAVGVVVAGAGVWAVRRYHTALIDYNYDRCKVKLIDSFKRLAAAWRLLIGLWLPARFDYSLPSFLSRSTLYAPDPPKIAGLPPQTPPEKYIKPQHIPSRVLVKHVLRTRLQAAKELAAVLNHLETAEGGEGKVNASYWLAQEYGGGADRTQEALSAWETQPMPGPRGSREGKEVVRWLRSKGARVRQVKGGEDHWAARGGAETE